MANPNDIPKKEEKVRIHITLERSHMRKLNAITDKTGRTTSEIIGFLINGAEGGEDA